MVWVQGDTCCRESVCPALACQSVQIQPRGVSFQQPAPCAVHKAGDNGGPWGVMVAYMQIKHGFMLSCHDA